MGCGASGQRKSVEELEADVGRLSESLEQLIDRVKDADPFIVINRSIVEEGDVSFPCFSCEGVLYNGSERRWAVEWDPLTRTITCPNCHKTYWRAVFES
mgnify:CR=1 FL=1